mmetsp:Transcript_12630/g.22941  ORF Transcript_12630/g.22941 Transcript_12630/m.22941 type:complete len:277 (+) Transcript_12630:167-997(+)|eukprot:CAMPEP_0202485168 /NCGR_PEP_ID=MMETSP1361-20130828/4074_1 /ASSEMBLY_ACC=CAM_ASM_000849 /TAXON_ID=210615 /ORGANISM="Staurosira complex sp., Strain CCMP2646" /LENGTH=276 /DNA_ID=CAMNT_0049114001 /DNA_START=154 /DNA_END=984 /DNA_ORIENTATION=-
MMLSNVVGIVTGGASGLGAATVASLLQRGARVVVADLGHQRDAFSRLAAVVCAGDALKARTNNDPVLAFAETDVTDENQVNDALDMAESAFGEPVNVAVNCAGIAVAKKTLSRKRDSSEILCHSLPDFSKTLQINTVGSFNVARLAAQRMATRDAQGEDGLRGCIINTASVAAYDGQKGQVAYAASKGAIVGMTLPMARDLASFGIRVMTIAPGLFETPLLEGLPDAVKAELGATIPLPSRLGKPEEFGELVISIVTNPMLNGEVIRLDGGLRMPP